jgi:hypothetical protein
MAGTEAKSILSSFTPRTSLTSAWTWSVSYPQSYGTAGGSAAHRNLEYIDLGSNVPESPCLGQLPVPSPNRAEVVSAWLDAGSFGHVVIT